MCLQLGQAARTSLCNITEVTKLGWQQLTTLGAAALDGEWSGARDGHSPRWRSGCAGLELSKVVAGYDMSMAFTTPAQTYVWGRNDKGTGHAVLFCSGRHLVLTHTQVSWVWATPLTGRSRWH
jgi:hypothetical protein